MVESYARMMMVAVKFVISSKITLNEKRISSNSIAILIHYLDTHLHRSLLLLVIHATLKYDAILSMDSFLVIDLLIYQRQQIQVANLYEQFSRVRISSKRLTKVKDSVTHTYNMLIPVVLFPKH